MGQYTLNMRKTALALSVCACLSACSNPAEKDMSPELDYLMNVYAVVTSAYAYDIVCNEARQTTAKDPVLTGNMSMIATQLYQAFRNTYDAPDDVLADAVMQSGKAMQDKQEKMLREKGCDAPELKPFADAYSLYQRVPADQNYIYIMKDMHDKGITRAAPRAAPAEQAPARAAAPEGGVSPERQKAIDLLLGK